MHRRILIANRGVVAARIIETCKRLGIETVIAYTRADENTLPVMMADDKVCIGEGPVADSYINMKRLVRAAKNKRCSAVHPGYGFLAENARFADYVNLRGLDFIGPDGQAIHQMGDKLEAKKEMQNAGLTVIPGPLKPIPDAETAEKYVREMGFPVILKPRYGGGGIGMEICWNYKQLTEKFARAQVGAMNNFKSGDLIIEKYLGKNGFKHIEAQVMAEDPVLGLILYMMERECSVQRGHQKMIEEATSKAISPKQRQELGEYVTQLCKNIGYKNAGTVEFILYENVLYAMEMNTRLQVEHRVTEKIMGYDIVEMMLRVACNGELFIDGRNMTQDDLKKNGHSIQARINLEDPDKNFKREVKGIITEHKYPSVTGVTYDTFIPEFGAGDPAFHVAPFYDSMAGIVVAHGRTRPEAISRLEMGLADMVIHGTKTNIPLHLKLLQSPGFRDGTYNTNIVKEVMKGEK